MGKNSKIEWTKHTWNPWQGCTKISPGCKNCYMYRDRLRYGQDPYTVVRSKPNTFNKPLSWKEPALVFTCSWSDFFIEEAYKKWGNDALEIIYNTKHLTYQILTKRPENIDTDFTLFPNIWIGISVENTEQLKKRIPIFLQKTQKAKVRFLSIEPQLEYINPSEFNNYADKIDWIITGGESGYNPRVTEAYWFSAIQNYCNRNNIAYFHKQNGGSKLIDGHWGGNKIYGQTYQEFPV